MNDDDDFFNFVDLSKKRYVSDETLEKLRLPISEVIENFQKVHGDRYDYSKVEYVNGTTKVVIICKEHGEFLQTPRGHKHGSNCPKCKIKVPLYNNEKIILEFQKVHGDRYDYSKVEYVNTTTKVVIICKEHGEFLQTPNTHRGTEGCLKCKIRVPVYNNEETIQKFQKIHGDRYDYSKVEYLNQNTHVIIICKEHGEFLQTPRRHKQGNNCPKCKIRVPVYNNEEIILKFQKVHGDRYDYSKVEYVHSLTKVVIICKEHGEFHRRPSNHGQGAGCPKCGYPNRHTTEECIQKFQKVHGDRYDYSKVEYVNNRTKVIIICKEHGEFLQTPFYHSSRDGANCPKCTRVPRYNNEEIIQKFQKVHGDRYDYSKVEYVNNKTKVIIICKEHGEFLQNTPHHSRGRGCHKCGKRKGKRKTITDTMTTQIIELRNSKKTIPAIAAEVGVSNSSVKRILKVNA